MEGTPRVDIGFDCLPLRSISRLDIPIDASPGYRRHCERVKDAIARHGSHNAYFLYNAHCTYFLTNRPQLGEIDFHFYGTVLTDDLDQYTRHCDLEVELAKETCDWLTQPVVAWLRDTVPRSVAVEFDRYIAAGDLRQTKERIAQIQALSDDEQGYIGMFL